MVWFWLMPILLLSLLSRVFHDLAERYTDVYEGELTTSHRRQAGDVFYAMGEVCMWLAGASVVSMGVHLLVIGQGYTLLLLAAVALAVLAVLCLRAFVLWAKEVVCDTFKGPSR